MRTDNPTPNWLKVSIFAVALLLGANLLVQVSPAQPDVAGRVAGGLPDQGAQLLAIVAELKATNKKLDEMQELLKSGKVTVQTKAAEEKPSR